MLAIAAESDMFLRAGVEMRFWGHVADYFAFKLWLSSFDFIVLLIILLFFFF